VIESGDSFIFARAQVILATAWTLAQHLLNKGGSGKISVFIYFCQTALLLVPLSNLWSWLAFVDAG
jgi:hypothetical protein